MRIPDPKANTTTEAYLAYKAGFLEESELKPKLYEPYLHYDAWLAYWAGLTDKYPVSGYGKNLISPTPYMSSTNVYSPEAGSKINHTYADYVTYELSDGTLSVTTDRQWGGVMMVSPALETGSYHISLTVTTGTSNNGRCRLQILDADYKVIENADYSSIAENSSKNLSWDITLSAGAKFIGVGVATSSSSGGNFTVSSLQLEAGSSATTYEPYSPVPEMLTDEEALVAYLSGVTNTYPEEIKDPYDVRITGYLRYLVSARFGRPDYPVNNEEFYLSNMKPPVVTNDTPSSSIELDDTAEAPFIDVKAYGDTSQTTYTGKNLLDLTGNTSKGVTGTVNADGSVTISGKATTTDGVIVFRTGPIQAGTYTFSISRALPKVINLSMAAGISFRIPAGETSVTTTLEQDYESGSIYYSVVTDAEYNETFKCQLETGETATSWEPYVGGIPAPNPDYPQAVNVVTGKQVVKVEGKNLLTYPYHDTINSPVERYGVLWTDLGDGTVKANGTPSGASVFSIASTSDYITIKPNTVYTMSGGNTSKGVVITFEERDASNNILVSHDNVTSLTFTSHASATRLTVGLKRYSNSVTINDFICKPQLELGSTATEFVPYGAGSYEINLDGKNLLDLSVQPASVNGVTASYDSLTNSLSVASTGSGAGYIYARYDLKTLKPGDTYSIKIGSFTNASVIDNRILYVASNNGSSTTQLLEVKAPTLSGTFTVPNDSKEVRVYFYTLLNTTSVFKEVQLELGSTATPYEPYHAPIELCKIDTYQDYIYQDTDEDWYIHKDIARSELNSEKVGFFFPATPLQTDYTDLRMTKSSIGMIEDWYPRRMVCNYFVIKPSGVAVKPGEFECGISSSNVRFALPTSITTLQQAKDYMDGLAGSYIYFVLKTATDTLITDSNLIAQLNALKEGGSYEGKTRITVTATSPNLPALLKVEAGEYR